MLTAPALRLDSVAAVLLGSVNSALVVPVTENVLTLETAVLIYPISALVGYNVVTSDILLLVASCYTDQTKVYSSQIKVLAMLIIIV